ncbi:MAG TPA: oligosaccharide flippase family protein [Bacteroidales bacterium]|nr:oligosaccharide flippase family protein [Bacteroidales bacterium]
MRRKFLVNIVFLLAVSLIIKTFWVLGIDRSVQNIAGEEAYGFYFSLFSFSVLFTLVLDMGLSGFNNRAVSADPSRVKLYFGNVLLLRLVLTVVYFAITLTAAWLMGYSGRQISLLLILMLNQFMASLTLWLRSNISGMQYLILDSLLSMADRLLMIIICSLLLWGGMTASPFRIEWFVWSQTAAYFTVMAVSFVIVIRRGGVSAIRPDASVLRGIIVSGLPYALVVFTMTIYWRIDSVLIERLLPDGAVRAGYYAQAFRLFDAFSMIPVMFGSLLLPIFSKEHAAGNDITPLASMASGMLLVPVGIIAVTMATFSKEILDLLYTSSVESAVQPFRILMVTLIPVGLTYIYSTMMTAAGLIRKLGLITGTALAVNLSLNLLLIPSLAGTGAAVASLAAQLIVASLCIIAVHRSMARVLVPRRVVLFILLLLITLATGLICRTTAAPWPLAAALQLIVGTSWALIFRLVEPLKSLKLILERRNSI